MNTNNNLKQKKNFLSSKERIDNALIELIEDNKITKITVAMVIEKAQVSKSTFYRNYYDIYDAYDSFMEDLAEKILDIIEVAIRQKGFENIGLVDIDFFKNNFHIPENFKVVFNQSIEQGNMRLLEFMYKKVHDILLESFLSMGYNNDDSSFLANFFDMAIVICYVNDFKSGNYFNLDIPTIMFDVVKNLRERDDWLECKKD